MPGKAGRRRCHRFDLGRQNQSCYTIRRMKRVMASLLLFACGCSTAPVADFLDWVSPSTVRPQGLNSAPAVVPAPPPTTAAPLIRTPSPAIPPTGSSFKTPQPLPASVARPQMPPLPETNTENRGSQ